MESLSRMSLYQLGRVESNDTAVGSGLFSNPKYEAAEGGVSDLDHFNLQLTRDKGAADAVNNDLTGNTMTSEASAGAMPKGSTGIVNTVFEDYLDLEAMQNSRKQSRRLSISDYNVDNAGYYEYEFFGKNKHGAVFSEDTGVDSANSSKSTNNSNTNNNNNNGNSNSNNDDNDFDLNPDDVVMMSDEDWVPPVGRSDTAVQAGPNNELFDFGPQPESFEAPSPDDYNFEVDVPLIEQAAQQPPKKKVKDYFRLSFFGGSSSSSASASSSSAAVGGSSSATTTATASNNASSGDLVLGDEPIFKKRYFWNRNPIKRRTRSDVDLFGMPPEEDSALINPSQLVATGDYDEDTDEHTVAEPVAIQSTGFSSFADSGRLPSSDATPSPTKAGASVVPPASFSPPLMRKKLGSMPKTRGRKPSPIPDASKHFGCDYCDRRFKRQEHLKRHVRSLHMCEKPFGCPVCGKKFSRSDNLNQHIKTHAHQQ